MNDNSMKLNLGCGRDIRAGWVNLDIIDLPGVDVVHDITQLPLPFNNHQFDIILCNDILEHIDYIPVLEELHRILQPGGKLQIRVPHFTSRFAYIDPTHQKYFSFQTFEFFSRNVKGSTEKGEYYFHFQFSGIDSRIVFEKGVFFYNYFIEAIINWRHITKVIFEATFLAHLFPAQSIEVELVK